MINKLLTLAALSATTASAKVVSPKMQRDLEKIQRDGIDGNSSLGRELINKSRRVEQENAMNQIDISFVSEYSLKFMGCHHVTSWVSDEQQGQGNNNNGNNQGQGQNQAYELNAANGRIRTKGLVRYKLCPTDSCSAFGLGCTTNFGEYIVDMNSFLEIYMKWRMEAESANCDLYRNTCYQECYESANANCYTKCYNKHGVNAALCSNQGNPNNQNDYSSYYGADENSSYGNNYFDLNKYLQCGEYDVFDQAGEEVAHFLGPYCADQGGDIKLGFFQDQYCTIPSTLQASYIQKQLGVTIPYTKTSLVSAECLSCEATEENNQVEQGNGGNYYNYYSKNNNYNYNRNGNNYYNYDANGNRNNYWANEVNEMCATMYMRSGKCETEYSGEDAPYPEEGGCAYLEGVKQLQNDGIIRANQKTSSKAASVVIGLFTGVALLLGGYVYYLKSKIQRSRVNLAGATTSLA